MANKIQAMGWIPSCLWWSRMHYFQSPSSSSSLLESPRALMRCLNSTIACNLCEFAWYISISASFDISYIICHQTHRYYSSVMKNEEYYLFDDPVACCGTWYPARGDCPDESEPTPKQTDGTEGFYYPHLDGSNCPWVHRIRVYEFIYRSEIVHIALLSAVFPTTGINEQVWEKFSHVVSYSSGSIHMPKASSSSFLTFSLSRIL